MELRLAKTRIFWKCGATKQCSQGVTKVYWFCESIYNVVTHTEFLKLFLIIFSTISIHILQDHYLCVFQLSNKFILLIKNQKVFTVLALSYDNNSVLRLSRTSLMFKDGNTYWKRPIDIVNACQFKQRINICILSRCIRTLKDAFECCNIKKYTINTMSIKWWVFTLNEWFHAWADLHRLWLT